MNNNKESVQNNNNLEIHPLPPFTFQEIKYSCEIRFPTKRKSITLELNYEPTIRTVKYMACEHWKLDPTLVALQLVEPSPIGNNYPIWDNDQKTIPREPFHVFLLLIN